jgi:hypothetical protein
MENEQAFKTGELKFRIDGPTARWELIKFIVANSRFTTSDTVIREAERILAWVNDEPKHIL